MKSPFSFFKTAVLGGILVIIPLFLVLSFLTGLATRRRTGIGTGRWPERTILHRVPGYRMARTLTKQFAGGEEGLRPGLSGENGRPERLIR